MAEKRTKKLPADIGILLLSILLVCLPPSPASAAVDFSALPGSDRLAFFI